MELTFLKRKPVGNKSRGKIASASLNRKGFVKVGKGAVKAYDLGNNFLFGRIAVDKNTKGFFLVEEKDEKQIQTDLDVIKLGAKHAFSFSELTEIFKDEFNGEHKFLMFKVEQKQILNYNVLQFTLENEGLSI